MPTPSEHKALAFVAIVILLAGAVRVVRAGALASADPTPLEQQGLARQAFAASSAAVDQRAAKEARASKSKKQPRMSLGRRDAGVKIVGGVASVPPSDVRPDRPSSGSWPPDPRTNALGFPSPGPRIDVGSGAPQLLSPVTSLGSRKRKSGAEARPAGPIDLDTATEPEIELLPRVGPALARRIVANRDSLGPFRSLEALRRVRGIGPSTVIFLGPLVTFSRQTRP